VSSWITAGDWTPGAGAEPDVAGTWFTGALQRDYHRLELKAQRDKDRIAAEEVRTRKAREENEARVRKAEEDERAREEEARENALAAEAAAAAARREAEEARLAAHQRFLVEQERRARIQAEIDNAQIEVSIRLEDEQIDAEIAKDLQCKGIHPSPREINIRRKAGGMGSSTAISFGSAP
jgi:hypothetical protein